jgi:hypothetical protein
MTQGDDLKDGHELKQASASNCEDEVEGNGGE